MNREMRACLPPGGAFLAQEAAPEAVLTPERMDSEARMLADAASDFLRGEVLPAADRLETPESGLLRDLLRKAGALGLLGIDVPAEFGGLGLPKSVSARIAEALAAEPSFAVSHNVHTSVASLPILFFGTPEQKTRCLPRLASGEWIGAYALSEAHAGSDAMAARTRAVLSADGRSYLLSGEKMWITNAGFADLFIVFAKIDGERFTAFLVERSFPGVSIGREEKKLGLKGSSTCRLLLDSVSVPVENVLGEIGGGAKVALYTLNLGRFKIAASSVGQARNLLGIATRYAKQRTAFGRPIAEFGLIREKLAAMAARLYAAEAMLYRVAGYLDAAFHGIRPDAPDSGARYQAAAEEYAIECALLKVACTETLDFCADECLQIHGGYGYSEEFPAARAWRDARINRIYEGTNEINRLNIVEILRRRVQRGRLELPALILDSIPVNGVEMEILAVPQQARAITVSTAQALFGFLSQIPLADFEEWSGALAEMLIALFAWESAHLRTERIRRSDSARARLKHVLAADAITANVSKEVIRSRALSLLADCGSPIPGLPDHIARFTSSVHRHMGQYRMLSQKVLESDGYPW